MPSPGQIMGGSVATVDAISQALHMSDAEASTSLENWHWPDGIPRCPFCSADNPYITGRLWDTVGVRRFRCRQCGRDYTAFSGTPLNHPKMRGQKYVAAIAAAKDKTLSARQFARVASINERTAHYLFLKLATVK